MEELYVYDLKSNDGVILNDDIINGVLTAYSNKVINPNMKIALRLDKHNNITKFELKSKKEVAFDIVNELIERF